MFAYFKNRNFVSNPQCRIFRNWHHLHSHAAGFRCPRIHGSIAAQRPIWFTGMSLTRYLVDIRQLASGGAAGNVVLVEANLYAAPGFFMVGFGAGNDQIGAEASRREAWASLGHF